MHLLWLDYFSPKFKTTGNPEGGSFLLSSRASFKFFPLSFLRPKILKPPKKKCKRRRERKDKSRFRVKQSSRSMLRNLWRVLRTCIQPRMPRPARAVVLLSWERRRAASVKVNFIAVYFQPSPKGISECFHLRLALGVIAWHPFRKRHRTPSEKIIWLRPRGRGWYSLYTGQTGMFPLSVRKRVYTLLIFGLESGMVFEETNCWSV